MTTTPTAVALRALREAVRDALAAGVTPVEVLDAVGAAVFRPESLEQLGLTHPEWDPAPDEKRAELRARLARHERESLSPGGRPRGWTPPSGTTT